MLQLAFGVAMALVQSTFLDRGLCPGLQGTCALVGIEQNGQTSPNRLLQFSCVVTFDKSICTTEISNNGAAKTVVSFDSTVDYGKQPHLIDLQSRLDGLPSVTGIFKIEGEILVMVYREDNRRPTEFEGRRGAGDSVLILKRQDR